MMTTTTEALSEVLRGYGRADETALASLLEVSDWERIARQELERRATSIVQALMMRPLRPSQRARSTCWPCADRWPTRSTRPPKPSPALPPNPAACGVFYDFKSSKGAFTQILNMLYCA